MRSFVLIFWDQVVVSEFNRLDDDRYYDVENNTSFEFDHVTQVRRVVGTLSWPYYCDCN